MYERCAICEYDDLSDLLYINHHIYVCGYCLDDLIETLPPVIYRAQTKKEAVE